MTSLDSPQKVALFLRRHGWQSSDSEPARELAGGISCRVWQAPTDRGVVVVKQALARLRVRAAWHADVARSQVEASFGQVLAELVPGAGPLILATDPQSHAFVMTSAPTGSAPWKEQLLAGEVDIGTAARVGRLLGLLHARANGREALRAQFEDRTNFRTLRVQPYLTATAEHHPDLADRILAVADYLAQPGQTLVHGDVSPKNILRTPTGDVLLIDHEVAHWGHGAFDTAFVVNHLCLKAVHDPARASTYLAAADALLTAYAEAVGTSGAHREETALVLGPLLLARVDGQSPVEYLSSSDRQAVRDLAREAITTGSDLDGLLTLIRQQADARTATPHPDEGRI